MKFKRIFLIVTDSFGVGELPDAKSFGDEGSNTLKSVSLSKNFSAPNLTNLGLFNIEGTGCVRNDIKPIGVYGKAAEKSLGKDTVTGHWEIAGIISEKAMPTYPNGFSEEVLSRIENETGIGALCNKTYSGTEVIRDYGPEHEKTGKMIVYTSADSVYQAAAHEDVIPLSELYKYCETARKILVGDNSVGRVIARPFKGEYPNYERTSNRHDYALEPHSQTILDLISKEGLDTICVGKISDIFAGRGVRESIKTSSNNDGMKKTFELLDRDFCGLCFVNLVDFDSKFGHRNDVDGYAEAISEFDSWLGGFLKELKEGDLLIITSDHGCDPSTDSTDHSREYIPIIAYSKRIIPCSIGTRNTFADIGKTIIDNFEISGDIAGEGFLDSLSVTDDSELISMALSAMRNSYAPYSNFNVGAALLCRDGSVICGCNVESAAYSPTCCAERTALVTAISEGKREFTAIAIVGGMNGRANELCPPCGVCRQFLFEICGGELDVILGDEKGNIKKYKLSELLPFGFSDKNLLRQKGLKNDY